MLLPEDGVVQVLEPPVFDELCLIEVLDRLAPKTRRTFVRSLWTILVSDDSVGIPGKHEGIPGLQVELLKIFFHIVQDDLKGGPIDEVDPHPEDLMAAVVNDGAREGNVELTRVIFLLVVV